MSPVLVFFAIAAAIGCVLWAFVRLRLRSAAQRPDATAEELCELKQANRITSFAVAASLAALALVGLALALAGAD